MWPTTTWANVLVIAPELANAVSLQGTPAQTLLLADALAMMGYAPSWADKLEPAQRYLTAHLATMTLRRGAAGPITDVGAGPAKITYGELKGKYPDALDSTSYGVEYKRIRNQVPGFRLAVGGGFYGEFPFG